MFCELGKILLKKFAFHHFRRILPHFFFLHLANNNDAYIDLQTFLPKLTTAKFRGKSNLHSHNNVKFQLGMAIRRILESDSDSYKKSFFGRISDCLKIL